MWISKDIYAAIIDSNRELGKDVRLAAAMQGENTRLKVENAMLRNDIEWFKHRLNQVEQERGTLILANTGVKVPVPEFVPQYENTSNALNEMPDFSTIGGDAAEETAPMLDPNFDFSSLPSRKR